MRVEACEKFGGKPLVTDAAVVVIRDVHGNPISVACETPCGDQPVITVSHCKDPDFNRILRGLGLDQVVICEEFSPAAPPAQQLILPRS